MKVILATILAAAIVTPAAAHYSKTTDTVTIKKHHGAVTYAHHPVTQAVQTKDVYVDGIYVGSDPDWRVRETMRQDAKEGDGHHKK